MKSDFLGAVIAMSAAIGSNLGVNVQKRSHNQEDAKPLNLRRPYYNRPMWWFGMFLVIVGSLGDFFALGFAAQTLVASLGGGSTIFANVVLAKFWLKQDLFITDIIGVALVTVGVVVLALASASEGKFTMDEIYILMEAPQFIVYTILTTAFIMTLFFRIHRSRAPILRAMPTPEEISKEEEEKKMKQEEARKTNSKRIPDSATSCDSQSSPFPSPVQNSVFMIPIADQDDENADNGASILKGKQLDDTNDTVMSTKNKTLIIDRNLPLYWAAVSGTIGGQSVLLAKCVMELIFASINGEENQFKFFGTYLLVGAMIVTLLSQTHTLNLATMCGDTMSVFPVFQAFWIGSGNISGIIFFQQSHTFNKTQWFMFPSALVLVMVGIYLISKHEKFGAAQYSMAMPLTLGSPRQHNIVAQSFQFTNLAPQEQVDLAKSSPPSALNRNCQENEMTTIDLREKATEDVLV